MAQSPARKKAYDKAYEAQPIQKKRRAMRNKARRELEKEGLVHKGDGKDVDHRVPLDSGGSNDRSNLRVLTEKKNRGWRRGRSNYKP